MTTEITETATVSKAENEALIQQFEISGLHGYRTVSLSSKYAATIIIAKNGSGKTTLLGALNAFLRMEFSRLRDLNFDEIKCRLRNVSTDLILKKEDMIRYLSQPMGAEILSLARQVSVDPARMFKFLSEEVNEKAVEDYRLRDFIDDDLFSTIVRHHEYNSTKALKTCVELKSKLTEGFPEIALIRRVLIKELEDLEIVYLPTYRRIEIPLTEEESDRSNKRGKSKFHVSASGIFTGNIQFGLSDISQRLSQLNNSILSESNRGYKEISANIINELIEGNFGEDISDSELPEQKELRLFFERLEEAKNVRYFERVVIPDLSRIYRGDAIHPDNSKFLLAFLGKLKKVMLATKSKELLAEQFVFICNKYLSASDVSTSIQDDDGNVTQELSVGDKKLQLNRQNLEVNVMSVPGGQLISMESLSSGEKQMISLFATLYLYPKEKLVLIDEPELSLSIDWQRQILVDVLNAPSCRQIIAITHSPFIFDNELEPFARSLQSSIDNEKLSKLDNRTNGE